MRAELTAAMQEVTTTADTSVKAAASTAEMAAAAERAADAPRIALQRLQAHGSKERGSAEAAARAMQDELALQGAALRGMRETLAETGTAQDKLKELVSEQLREPQRREEAIHNLRDHINAVLSTLDTKINKYAQTVIQQHVSLQARKAVSQEPAALAVASGKMATHKVLQVNASKDLQEQLHQAASKN